MAGTSLRQSSGDCGRHISGLVTRVMNVAASLIRDADSEEHDSLLTWQDDLTLLLPSVEREHHARQPCDCDGLLQLESGVRLSVL